jgi:hypothetical protein
LKRVIELDFFRGIALLIIFWDHLHWFVKVGAPFRYGFSDAAAVFIFLSGYVSGLVYSKVYYSHGFRVVMFKAVRRSLQIYSAHIIAFAVLFLTAVLTPASTDPLHAFLYQFLDNPVNLFFKLISLRYFPQLFDILPLYVVLILLVPFVLVLLKKNWLLVPVASFILYSGSQFYSWLNIQTLFPDWTLNPFSWFFLFTSAITIAVKRNEGKFNIPVHPLLVFIVCCFLAYAISDLTLVNRLLQFLGVVTEKTEFLFPSPFPLTGKTLLEPVSLLHFLCVAYIVYLFIPKLSSYFNSRFAKPIVLCGQHSLSLFSTGIVITYVFSYLIIYFRLPAAYYFVLALTGWGVTLILAVYLTYRKNRIKIKTVQSAGQQTLTGLSAGGVTYRAEQLRKTGFLNKQA